MCLLLTQFALVPGYGKTHLARVFTRLNNALYLKLGDTTDSTFIEPIQAQIDLLKSKIFSEGFDKADASQYKEFTTKSQQVVEVFFLCAIKHYVNCYQHLLDLKHDAKTATAICSQVFDNQCGAYFREHMLEDAWTQMNDDNWLKKLYLEVEQYAWQYNIQALFCDEVHSLQGKCVGEFSHTALPAEDKDWPEV